MEEALEEPCPCRVCREWVELQDMQPCICGRLVCRECFVPAYRRCAICCEEEGGE